MSPSEVPGGPGVRPHPSAEATPEQEAQRVAEILSDGRHSPWARAGEQSGPWGQAWVCRLRPARVAHVIGSSVMADKLRQIFASGQVRGWSLQPLPEQLTPLHHYREALIAAPPQPGQERGYNQLDRAGFAYGEEVAGTPDDALRALRNIGDTAVQAYREIFGGPPNPASADTVAAGGAVGSGVAAGRLAEAATRLREEAERLDDAAARLRSAAAGADPTAGEGDGDRKPENSPTAWQVHGSRTVYDASPWVRVDLADLTAPDGQRLEHHVLHLTPVAVAMVVDEDAGTVLMLHRQRWAIDCWGYEFLGGLIEDGEDSAAAARRECREESGWDPIGAGEHYGTATAIPGMVTGPVHIHLWRRGARQVGQPSDPHEPGTLVWVPLARLHDRADRGQLLGAATLIGTYRYLTHHPVH